MTAVQIPLAQCADEALHKLARDTGSRALAALDGTTLLGERAMLAGFSIPARTSAGGGCRLYDALDDTVALNLARPADRELLPALFQTDETISNDAELAAQMACSNAAELVQRGRSMGLAIAAEHEPSRPGDICVQLAKGCAAPRPPHRAPRVLDLSALWAGPLAAHLLWLAGAEVVKLECRTRPDAMRTSSALFYALLNQGKRSVAVDFADANDRQALLTLIRASDIVIEAARPRALAQLGIDAAALVGSTPGQAWITITAHGAQGEPANWIGFGDDCGVGSGLSAALREATGSTGFVGDAIADPLTGIFAAFTAWNAWMSGEGGRFAVTMSSVAAQCLDQARTADAEALHRTLVAWAAAAGQRFPAVARRHIGTLPEFGEHTHSCLSPAAPC